MALVTILSEDNFTSQFYVKRGGDSKKAVLLTPLKTKWPFLAIFWPNMGLITILSEDNFTSQFYVKRVAIPQKAVLLTPLKTKWPFLAMLCPNLAKMGLITNRASDL